MPLGGSFRLELAGKLTEPIAHPSTGAVSADAIEDALNELPDVEVEVMPAPRTGYPASLSSCSGAVEKFKVS